MTYEVRDAPPWRYSTLHPPGRYLDKATGRAVYWSGIPPVIETWEQAELNAAAQMRALGYFDAEVTPPGVDRGIDIRSRSALAQVKREKTKAGGPDVQRLYGARGTERKEGRRGLSVPKELWFFSALGYAWPAIEYADRNSILLFTYAATGEITPVNQIARTTLHHLLAKRGRWMERQKAYREAMYTRAPAPATPAGAVSHPLEDRSTE